MAHEPIEPPDWDAMRERSFAVMSLLGPVTDSRLPPALQARWSAAMEPLGGPGDRPNVSHNRTLSLANSHLGLLAAYYHRDRIAAIEVEVIARVRDHFPSGMPTGSGMGVPMTTVAHEYVAWLMACRRTLDYLAHGVSCCFRREPPSPKKRRIKDLAKLLKDAEPPSIAADVIEQCGKLAKRFPHLISDEKWSDRDLAAHIRPAMPPALNISTLPDGRLGILVLGEGILPGFPDNFEPDRMAEMHYDLTDAIDARQTVLDEFCLTLVQHAVSAERYWLVKDG